MMEMPLRQPRDRLTDHEQKRLLELWALGVTARAAAQIVEWNRNTVMRYFTRFRTAAAKGAAASAAAAPLAGVVECDESYFGGDPRKASYEPPKEGQKRGRGAAGKVKVFGMVERGTGRVVPVIVPDVKARTLHPLIEQHVDKEKTDLMTDDFKSYQSLEKAGWNHFPVNHAAGEWKEAYTGAHTNTIESVWRQFKRHLARFNGGWRKHAGRWLGECAARWLWRGPKDLLAGVAGVLRKSPAGL